MARSRNIKPSIMDNEDLAALPALTRLLFIYMWMLADRDGRLEDRPSRIKKQALGYDDGNADDMLDSLAKAGFIERYKANGAKVILILAFNKHQTPHVREAASELPCQETEPVKELPSTNLGSAEHLPRSPDTPFPLPDTPYLIPDTPTLSADASGDVCVLKPGIVCIAMKSQGIGDVNPGNAELLMLIASGASMAEFEGAAATAKGKAKGFVYALGIVRRSRQEVAATKQTLHQGAMPTTQKAQPKTFAERDREAGWSRWEETTNRVHPDRIKADQKSGHVIDISPLNLEIAQ